MQKQGQYPLHSASLRATLLHLHLYYSINLPGLLPLFKDQEINRGEVSTGIY
jgi:hypothetical protein